MRIHLSRFILFLILPVTLLGCGGGSGQTANNSSVESSVLNMASSASSSSASAATASDLTTKIDTYLASYQAANLPGISVIVVKNGKLAYSGGGGMADLPSGVVVANTTGFRLASVSKPFTAIAIMQLVERGEIKVTDSLLNFIPELPESWRKITIEHLLTHSSGVADIINDGWRPQVINGMTHSKLISYLINNPTLEFEPGTQHDYSNTGFMLLATVIERKTGLSFPEYMQQNIFAPANMLNSYINDENQAIKYGDALNYARLTTYYGIITFFKGSMAQVSSRDDFFNFFAAMRDNKLISAQTLAIMSRPHGTVMGVTVPNGYGFFVGFGFLLHSGQWDGFETELAMGISNGLEFAILTNSGSAGRAHINAIRTIIMNTPI